MNGLTNSKIHQTPSVRGERSLGTELRKKLRDAGCFSPARGAQALHMLIVAILYFGAYVALLQQPGWGWRLGALTVLAFASVQAGYVAHEAGHGAITRKRWLVLAIGQFYNTFLTALCYSHFQKIHTCHHAHCNRRDKDIDMQSNLFSLYPEARQNKAGWPGRLVTRYQAYLIWPLVSLQGFTLKFDSVETLMRNPRGTRIDQAVLAMHLLLWFGLPVYQLGLADAALNYLLMTWFIGPYLGTVFLVNHVGTHVIQPGEKTTGIAHQLMTTRNLGDSMVEDIFFGGLNNHIEHHLYPSIPSIRLRRARKIVQTFCLEHGLVYRQMSWRRAAGEVFAYLNLIARQPAGPAH